MDTNHSASEISRRWLPPLTVVLVVWIVLMAFEVSFFKKTSEGPGRLGTLESPVAPIELAGSASRLLGLLDQDQARNLAVMRINTYMDFVFILLYWNWFLLLAHLFADTHIASLRSLLIGAAGVAAGFDFAENFAMLSEFRMAGNLSDGPVELTQTLSQTKWCAFAVALLGVFLLGHVAAKRGDVQAGTWRARTLRTAALVGCICIAVGLVRISVLGAFGLAFIVTLCCTLRPLPGS